MCSATPPGGGGSASTSIRSLHAKLKLDTDNLSTRLRTVDNRFKSIEKNVRGLDLALQTLEDTFGTVKDPLREIADILSNLPQQTKLEVKFSGISTQRLATFVKQLQTAMQALGIAVIPEVQVRNVVLPQGLKVTAEIDDDLIKNWVTRVNANPPKIDIKIVPNLSGFVRAISNRVKNLKAEIKELVISNQVRAKLRNWHENRRVTISRLTIQRDVRNKLRDFVSDRKMTIKDIVLSQDAQNKLDQIMNIEMNVKRINIAGIPVLSAEAATAGQVPGSGVGGITLAEEVKAELVGQTTGTTSSTTQTTEQAQGASRKPEINITVDVHDNTLADADDLASKIKEKLFGLLGLF